MSLPDFINDNDLNYPILVLLLFVVPKFLSRWKVPSGITAFCIGTVSSYLGWTRVTADPTVYWVATFGITSLFLYAGMDVDLEELTKSWKTVLQHLLLRLLIILAIGFFADTLLGLDHIGGMLIAIGTVGPSTGFIFDSISMNSRLNESQRKSVRLLAISTEILAVLLMLLTVQLSSPTKLAYNLFLVILLVFLLPRLVSVFARFIRPHAPDSEFGFLILVAIMAGILTRKMGTYYIVGAFIAGIAAHQFRKYVNKEEFTQLTKSVVFFSNFFLPFYFFWAGAKLRVDQITLSSALIGLSLFLVGLALRLSSVILHRKFLFKTSIREEMPVAMALIPTLIFGLVICDILRFYELASGEAIGGLTIATLLFSITPFFYEKLWGRKLEPEPPHSQTS